MESKNTTKSQDGTLLRFRHTFITPILVCVVFLLVLITGAVDFSGADATATEVYLSMVALQLFIFMLPCVLYIRYRSLDVRETLRIRLPSPDKIMFIALCALLLILASILASALGVGGGVYTTDKLWGTDQQSKGTAAVYYAVCFAFIPAICEELLFRSIVMSEYQQTSVLAAVVISSLYFAMLHFDFVQFPFYFFSGLVLSVCAYAANSVIAAFFVHLLYNLFAIFGGGVVKHVFSALGDILPITVVAAGAFLLVLCLTFGECQRIYTAYARKNRPSDYVVKYKKGTGGIRFALALLSPASLVLIVMFIITTLLQ